MASKLPSKIATQFNNAAAVTPHDSNANAYAALYVGTAGHVAVSTKNGDAVTFSNVPAGAVLPIGTALVKATGTTALNILGLW